MDGSWNHSMLRKYGDVAASKSEHLQIICVGTHEERSCKPQELGHEAPGRHDFASRTNKNQLRQCWRCRTEFLLALPTPKPETAYACFEVFSIVFNRTEFLLVVPSPKPEAAFALKLILFLKF